MSGFWYSLIDLSLQMLKALKELHESGYIHRDVKPDNFRVTEDGLLKILDLGLVGEYIKDGVHKDLGRYGF